MVTSLGRWIMFTRYLRTFFFFSLSITFAGHASANPIVIELFKGVAYGAGSMAGKEIYESLRGGPPPSESRSSGPAPPPRYDGAGMGSPTTPSAPVVNLSAQPPPDALVLGVRNWSGEPATMQFYSPTRPNGAWPGVYRGYYFAQGTESIVRLRCYPGERICFGAWSRAKYWGTGYRLRYSCQACCRICGSPARGLTLR